MENNSKNIQIVKYVVLTVFESDRALTMKQVIKNDFGLWLLQHATPRSQRPIWARKYSFKSSEVDAEI